MTGESPVIDTSATRVQQNFKLEQLNSIPNGRDMWALLAATPGVVMSRIDVGGNRAGTQTGYTAYGLNGQVRVSVEGINTTEGTGGAGFYFDYGSFEEVFLGVAGQGAEAATPGVQSQFLGKSGGNRFSGEVYVDGYNNSFQGSNLTDEHAATRSACVRGQQRGAALLRRQHQRRRTDQAGQGVVPLLVAPAVQRRRTAALPFDQSFDTWNQNPSGKATYQMNQNHKFIGYYQWNMKVQPTRLPHRHATPTTASARRRRQESPSWVWKGEWNGTLSDKLYVEARYGDFGYYDRAAQEQRRGLLLARQRAADPDGRAHREPERSRSQAAHRRGHLLPRHQDAAATRSSSAARCTANRSGAAARRTSAATSSTSTTTACRAR